jgi:hypothetical protein
MNLSQIIETNETGKQSILTELLYKYKKSLYTYYKSYYNCEPVLMVTDVFNTCQYALIVPSNEFNDAIDTYLEDSELTEEEKQDQVELISFQSIMLSKF